MASAKKIPGLGGQDVFSMGKKYPMFGVNGIISTFAITLIPEYKEIIRRGSEALAPQVRMVIADLRKPDRWPLWIVNFMVRITRPFGASLDITRRKPWEAMQTYLANNGFTELYGGFTYISAGEKS